jgi:hypothetical protein
MSGICECPGFLMGVVEILFWISGACWLFRSPDVNDSFPTANFFIHIQIQSYTMRIVRGNLYQFDVFTTIP